MTWGGLVVLLFLLVVSCASLPHRDPLPVEVPAQFSTVGRLPRADRWWVDLKDPLLDTLIEQGLAHNLSLRGVWDRLAQAEALARKEGATLVPAVNAQGGLARTTRRAASISGSGQETTHATDFSLGATASYELDLWGRLRSARAAAEWDVHASQEDVKTAAMTLSAQVGKTWYQLVEQNAQLDLLDRQLRTNLEVLELVTLRFHHGQVRATDVLRQRQLVESIHGEQTQVRSLAAVLAHQLAILLGRPPADSVAVRSAALVALPPLPETGLPADLIQRRPDIRRAYYGLLAADQRVAAAIADQFPKLSLSAQASTSAGGVGDLFTTWLANLTANLVGPVFDGGRRKAEVARVQAVAAERLHNYGQVVLVALGEVEDALVQEEEQRQLLASLETQLTLAQQVIQRARDNYTNGASDYLRVLDALQTHQRLERTRLAAHRILFALRIDLYRSLGGGWSMDRPAEVQ